MTRGAAVRPRPIGWAGGTVWILATCAGWILVGAGSLARSVLFGVAPLSLIAFACLQWGALRWWVPRVGWWVPATVVGGFAGPVVATPVLDALGPAMPQRGPGAVLEAIAGLALIGVAVGGAQWLVLRRTLSRAGWWVVASAVAWASAEPAAASLVEVVDQAVNLPGLVAWYLVFWTANGLIHGILSGTALVWLSRPAAGDAPGP